MEECTWACLNEKREKSLVMRQWSQILEITAPLMLCIAQKTTLLDGKELQETPPPLLRKCYKISPKVLNQKSQKPRKGLGWIQWPQQMQIAKSSQKMPHSLDITELCPKLPLAKFSLEVYLQSPTLLSPQFFSLLPLRRLKQKPLHTSKWREFRPTDLFLSIPAKSPQNFGSN